MVWAAACQEKRDGSESGDKCHLQSRHYCVTLSLSFNHLGFIALPFICLLFNLLIPSVNILSAYYVPDTMLHTYLVLTKYNQYKDDYSNFLSSRNSRLEKHTQINCSTALLVLKQGALITRFEDGQVYKGIEIVLPDKED